MDTTVAEHFRLWLRAGMTGCEFIQKIAGKANRIAIESHTEIEPDLPARLNDMLDAQAAEHRLAFVLFPRITTERELLGLLQTLESDSRWRLLDRSPSRAPSRLFIGLEWINAAGARSEPMGFAPLGSMPVPRRAPYVAIAAWPGGHANPMRGIGSTPAATQNQVSFLDTNHSLTLEKYEEQWRETADKIQRLMREPPDQAKLYRQTAFVLSRSGGALVAQRA